MPKITFQAIARQAGVSRATVDRVLNHRPGVQAHTRQHVQQIAAQLRGETLPSATAGTPTLPSESTYARHPPLQHLIDVLMPDNRNSFFDEYVSQLNRHAETLGNVELRIRRVPGLDPDAMAHQLDSLVETTGGVVVVSLDSPTVREALRRLIARKIPVITVISDISHVGRLTYVGIDNRAAGRLAGFLIGRMLPVADAEVALVPGLLAYRGHEEREAGFRHVLKESFDHLKIVAAPEIREDNTLAFDATCRLLTNAPDLRAIYCIGAGQQGIARALGEAELAQRVMFIGHDLTDSTRRWLLDGTMDVVIDQNARVEARESIDRLVQALLGKTPISAGTIRIQPVFRENIPTD